jgi:hypothetical protein
LLLDLLIHCFDQFRPAFQLPSFDGIAHDHVPLVCFC